MADTPAVEFPAVEVCAAPSQLRPVWPRTEFCSRFLVSGSAFLWLEIFVDGVSLTKSRGALSSDGVYVSLSNTRRDCKHFQSFVGTLFLVPPGVDTLSLLEFVSADILKLRGESEFTTLRWTSGVWFVV